MAQGGNDGFQGFEITGRAHPADDGIVAMESGFSIWGWGVALAVDDGGYNRGLVGGLGGVGQKGVAADEVMDLIDDGGEGVMEAWVGGAIGVEEDGVVDVEYGASVEVIDELFGKRGMRDGGALEKDEIKLSGVEGAEHAEEAFGEFVGSSQRRGSDLVVVVAIARADGALDAAVAKIG